MIVYVDSSVLARTYLPDEDGHRGTVSLLLDPELTLVTGTWTRIEVSGAIVRGVRGRGGDPTRTLALLDREVRPDGQVVELAADQAEVEQRALQLARTHGLRAMDAWHLATAATLMPAITEPDEVVGFASRDRAQRAVARSMGFRPV